jgi:hypothetical protein
VKKLKLFEGKKAFALRLVPGEGGVTVRPYVLGGPGLEERFTAEGEFVFDWELRVMPDGGIWAKIGEAGESFRTSDVRDAVAEEMGLIPLEREGFFARDLFRVGEECLPVVLDLTATGARARDIMKVAMERSFDEGRRWEARKKAAELRKIMGLCEDGHTEEL